MLSRRMQSTLMACAAIAVLVSPQIASAWMALLHTSSFRSPTTRLLAMKPHQQQQTPDGSAGLKQNNGQRRFAQPNQKKANAKKRKYDADRASDLSFPLDASASTTFRRSDSRLGEINAHRIKTAGRVGTKRFVDPCKVFVGNLPFNVTANEELGRFILQEMGESRIILNSAKIIKDWKTGKSKGYGFAIFIDPIYATVCMDVVNGRSFHGRLVSVTQGKRKEQENHLLMIKQKREKRLARMSQEEAAIVRGLEAAESEDEVDMEMGEDGVMVFGGGSSGGNEDDLEIDARLFGMAAKDDEDDEFDGFDEYLMERQTKYDEIDPNLNREQRREAQKRIKREKRQAKGFGGIVPRTPPPVMDDDPDDQ